MRFFKYVLVLNFALLMSCDKEDASSVCLEMKQFNDDHNKIKFSIYDTIAFLSCSNPTSDVVFDYGWQIIYTPDYSVVHTSKNSSTYFVPQKSGEYKVEFNYSFISNYDKELRNEFKSRQFIVSPPQSISFRIPREENVGPLGQTIFVKLFTENQIPIDSGYIYDYAEEGQVCGGLNVLTFEDKPDGKYYYNIKNISTGFTSSSYLNHYGNCTYRNI